MLWGAHTQQSASETSHPIGYSWRDEAGQLSFLAAGVNPPEPHQLLLVLEILHAVLGPAESLLWGQWGKAQTYSPEPDLGNKKLKY